MGDFESHLGCDGVMLVLPDRAHHLEFTHHIHKVPSLESTKENLMVFYYGSPDEYKHANKRIQEMEITPVAPENPCCKDKSETYEDPDGWRVILFNGVYNP